MMANKGTYNGVTILKPETVDAMWTQNWLNDGTNGDTDANLFQSWGLGT